MNKKNENKLVPKFRFPEFKNEREWSKTSVKDLIEQHIEKSSYTNQYPVLTSSREGILFQRDYYNDRDVASKDNTGYNVVPRGYFTYRHMSNDFIFKFNINNICDRGIVSTLYPVFSAIEKKINPLFLQQILNEGQEFRRFSITQKQGGSRTYMYLNKLKELKITIPGPSEQNKITKCISSLDEVITAESKTLEVLKEYKKGLLQNLFPQEGETVPKVRFKEFEDSGKWEDKTLGEVAEIITGNTPSTNVKDYYGGDKMLVSPADINDSRYVVEAKTTLTDLGFSKTRKIKADSVLFVCVGSTIGKVAQNKFECATNQQINSLVPFEGYSSSFIYSLLERYSQKIASLAGKQAVPLINKTAFSLVKLPFPTDIAEQQKIASVLSSVDELIIAQGQKIEALKLHKKGLLQGLFPNINEQNG